MDNNDHICEENLDFNCKCKLCGRVCHDWYDNDDGTFAASGKVVTTQCQHCGKIIRYYADTGTIIDD